MKRNLLLFALLSCSASHAADFHVSPGGADKNDGKAATPFASFQRALTAVRAHKASRPAEDNRIVLHGGDYQLDRTIVLTPEDSGQPGQPLVIEAAPGEKPVLTSARPITGWKPARDNTPGLSPEVRGKVFVSAIPKDWRFHFLYVDGQPQHVASLCKPDQHWRTWPTAVRIGQLEPAGQLLTLPPGQLDGLPSNGDVEMNLMPVQYWNTLSVLRDVDARANTVRRHSKNPTTFWRDRFGTHGEGQYNLQNALKFLTKPGEWCVDSAAGRVYFYPESGSPEGKKIWAPSLYRLLEIKGSDERRVHDIAIRGLRFECTDRLPEDKWPDEWVKRQAELPDGMVFLEGVEDCGFSGNTLTWSGSYGIAMQGTARRVHVIGNEIAYPGCGGILLQGYGPGTTDVNRDHVIRRNYIHHTGNGGYLHSAAVTLYQSGGNDISLNWIADVPYAGIQIAGAAWNEFGTGKPAGFDAALSTILAEAAKEGGIAGNPSADDIAKLPPDPVLALPAKPIKPGEWIDASSVTELRGPKLDDKKSHIGWVAGGHSAVFGPYQFDGGFAGNLQIEAGVDPKYPGGKIHVRTSPDGPDLACFTLESTGGFESWKILSAPITIPAGKHPLYLMFEGGHAVCSLRRFRLTE